MRNRVLGCLLAACALPAMAQLAPPATSPAGFGSGLSASPGPGLPVQNKENRQQAWRLLAGYQFTPALGLEASLGDAPRSPVTGLGLSAGGDLRLRSWALSGTGQMPLSRSWSVLGKVGVGSARGDLAATSSLPGAFTALPFGQAPRSDTFLGLGLGYNVSRSFGLRLEYESYGGGLGLNNPRGDNWALSLKYSF
ncbi:MAG: porin family protein [Burkholderiales bacterium]|nr:porin family protein [Burkholderiales bacterium]